MNGQHRPTAEPVTNTGAPLLEKCLASKYFDDEGMLRKLPE